MLVSVLLPLAAFGAAVADLFAQEIMALNGMSVWVSEWVSVYSYHSPSVCMVCTAQCDIYRLSQLKWLSGIECEFGDVKQVHFLYALWSLVSELQSAYSLFTTLSDCRSIWDDKKVTQNVRVQLNFSLYIMCMNVDRWESMRAREMCDDEEFNSQIVNII